MARWLQNKNTIIVHNGRDSGAPEGAAAARVTLIYNKRECGICGGATAGNSNKRMANAK